MVQDILVVVFIILASIYAGWKLYLKLKPKADDECDTNPSGCGGCGEDCALRDMKNHKKTFVKK